MSEGDAIMLVSGKRDQSVVGGGIIWAKSEKALRV